MCGKEYSVTRGVPGELVLAVKKFQNSSEYILSQNPPTTVVPSSKDTSLGTGNDRSVDVVGKQRETGSEEVIDRNNYRQVSVTNVVMV